MKSNFYRSIRPEVFFKIDVRTDFAKFTGKHLCQGLCFTKVPGLRPATLFKKKNPGQLFFCQIWIFENTYFEEHLRTAAFVSRGIPLFLYFFFVIYLFFYSFVFRSIHLYSRSILLLS